MDALGLEVPSPKPTANEIYVLDLTSGEQAKVPAAPGLYWVPRVSRDGTRVAFLSYEGMSSGPAAYLADLANGTVEKISESDQADSISISADGTRIAYFAETDEEWIKSIRVYDTTMGDFVFTSEDSRFRELQIFPAGDKLAVTEEEPITHARRPGDPEPEDRLRIIDIESGERVTIPGDIPSFTISPNGRYMGYAARNGQFDKGVPTGVTDTGLEYGETKLDVAYRGYIREVE
jgi:Tol biopolymer transport system component